ncbi:amidohydrolase family protein [Deinococcus maricopensis]|uniref:S-adenosylhomocysteine deaminase n=1 Tax=Deinococcus maricopensis (strain DSM 21211 / LMG 22137 / NRRL B-23946 / LB-34) TaxID=709986 RepID=E8U7T2_DEIML|nr:amidohydrolase family protein [Deinococcus maricopensis]ADV67121.1 S-adenosylhomocysteine deaminase [Deinococcus maricopensis DSM 21211]
MTLTLYTADVVYTGMGLPVADGAVAVSGDVIAAAGPRVQVRAQFPDAPEVRAARVIAPPPVNAHAHLDMTLYPFRPQPYFSWIPDVVVQHRDRRGLDAARLGLRAVQASGAGGLGDIVWSEDVMEFLLREADLPGVAYWEVIDMNPDTAEATFHEAVRRVEAWRRLERPGGMRVGLTPHTPHTVSARLLRLLAAYARAEALPLQIHVAEHPSELELYRTGGGPLAASLARLGAPPHDVVMGRAPDAALTPVRHLADLGVLDARPTLIHMVNTTKDDARAVAQAGCVVVSCPRSNANLECGTFPWATFAAAGAEVALGTDSVASGETLNVHDEVRAAFAVHPNLDARQIIRAAVKGGRRALGLGVPFLRRGETWHPEYIWPDPVA